MKRKALWPMLALWGFAAVGCHHETAANGWIQGDSGQRWQTVERHLRGLDVAMVEMGYRYEELYWAGVDLNWEYADYQLAKVNLSLENALERRPQRRASAEELFRPLLDEMKRAVAARERAVFEKAFGELTAGCNACHVAEGVASFHVEPPSIRQSPIRAPR
jgi:hypothetical protein